MIGSDGVLRGRAEYDEPGSAGSAGLAGADGSSICRIYAYAHLSDPINRVAVNMKSERTLLHFALPIFSGFTCIA